MTLSAIVLIILCVAVGSLYVSCKKTSYPSELVAADSLCESNPHKAISYLRHINNKSSLNSMSDAAKWYYRLLCVKAKYKCDITLTNLNEISAIAEHYESYFSDQRQLPLAYYYLGKTYYADNNFPMALESYKKSLDKVSDTDIKLASIVNFQTGFLLLEQSFFSEALPYFRESLRMEKIQKDSAMIAYCMQKIAYCYQGKSDDSCLHYYKEAIEIAEKSRNQQICDEMKNSLASYYIQKAQYDKALKLSLPVLKTMNSDNGAIDSFYDIIGLSYMGLGKLDSALYYFHKLNAIETIEAKTESNLQLARIYKKKGDTSKALFYIDQYEQNNDSLQRVRVASSIAKVNALFNYSKYKDQNISLEQSRYKIVISLIIVIMLSLFGIILFVFWYRKTKRKEMIQKLNWQRYKKEQTERNDKNIKEKDAMILYLQSQLNSVQSKSVASNIAQQKETLELQRDRIRNKQSIEKDIRHHFMSSDIYQSLCHKATNSKCLTRKEIELLDCKIMELVPDFVSNLKSLCRISQQDIRMCALIKLCDFNSSQIAVLLGRDKSTISKAKKKLIQNLLGENSKHTDFNEYIKMMV